MAKQGKRAQRKAELEKQKRNRRILWGVGSVAGLALVVALFVFLRGASAGRLMGEEIGGLSRDHVTVGTDPGPYATNPPAGGRHYPQTYDAGFYTEEDAAGLQQRPEGFLVHNLEHGYVIFWYNCDAQPGLDCAALQDTIRGVMDQFGGVKLIAFPWPSMTEPLVLTSWGRYLPVPDADPDTLAAFVRNNLNQAPESNAP